MNYCCLAAIFWHGFWLSDSWSDYQSKAILENRSYLTTILIIVLMTTAHGLSSDILFMMKDYLWETIGI